MNCFKFWLLTYNEKWKMCLSNIECNLWRWGLMAHLQFNGSTTWEFKKCEMLSDLVEWGGIIFASLLVWLLWWQFSCYSKLFLTPTNQNQGKYWTKCLNNFHQIWNVSLTLYAAVKRLWTYTLHIFSPCK